MVKPEFWQSKTLRKCSLESRLLFIGLWNFCDDYGVCLNSNRKLLGEIFPFDENISEKRLEKWKNELIENKLVVPVEYDSTKYLIIRSWKEHQKVDNPNKRRYLDEEIQEKLTNEYLESSEGLDSQKLYKEKEKEKGKEKGKEKRESTHPLGIWIKENLPEVSKLEKQLTDNDCEKLVKDFGGSLVKEILEAMDNYKPLLKKYKDVNRTLRNWIKIREERNGTTKNNKGNTGFQSILAEEGRGNTGRKFNYITSRPGDFESGSEKPSQKI